MSSRDVEAAPQRPLLPEWTWGPKFEQHAPNPSRSAQIPMEQIEAAFQERWTAEGVVLPFRLPSNYLQLSYTDQVLCLINLERDASGLPALRRVTAMPAPKTLPPPHPQEYRPEFALMRQLYPGVRGIDSATNVGASAAERVFLMALHQSTRDDVLLAPGDQVIAFDQGASYEQDRRRGWDGLIEYLVVPMPPADPPTTRDGATTTAAVHTGSADRTVRTTPSRPPLAPSRLVVGPPNPAEAALSRPDVTTQQITTAFQERWTAQGITERFALPPGFTAMAPPEQTNWLINNDRRVLGLPPVKLDRGGLQQLSATRAGDGNRQQTNPWDRAQAMPGLDRNYAGEAVVEIANPAGAAFQWLYRDPRSSDALTHPNTGWVGIATSGSGHYVLNAATHAYRGTAQPPAGAPPTTNVLPRTSVGAAPSTRLLNAPAAGSSSGNGVGPAKSRSKVRNSLVATAVAGVGIGIGVAVLLSQGSPSSSVIPSSELVAPVDGEGAAAGPQPSAGSKAGDRSRAATPGGGSPSTAAGGATGQPAPLPLRPENPAGASGSAAGGGGARDEAEDNGGSDRRVGDSPEAEDGPPPKNPEGN